MRRRPLAVAALIAALALALGALLASGARSPGTPAESDPMPETHAPRPLFDHRLPKAFSVLRKPRGSLPAPVASSVRANPVARRTGFHAWNVLTTLQRQVWAVAYEHQLCLIDRSGRDGLATACTTTDRALRHGLMSTFLRDQQGQQPAERLVVGLVPDRAELVEVHTPGFSTVLRRSVGNILVFEDHVPEPPEELRLIPAVRG